MTVYLVTNSLYMCPNCIMGEIRYYAKAVGFYKHESVGFCPDCEWLPSRHYIKTATPLKTRTTERTEND